MGKNDKAELRILSSVIDEDLILVVGKLISGDIYFVGHIDEVVCIETDSKWQLEGRRFPSGTGDDDTGLRLFILKHVEGINDLQEGYTLLFK